MSAQEALAVLAILIAGSAGAQTINTVAGNGTAGFIGDGPSATSLALNQPRGVAFDGAGNLYIADEMNHRIRKVTPTGAMTTIAGNGTAGYSGDGGFAVSAQLNQPEDVLVDSAGNLFIADSSNQRIRKVTPAGIISTVAGTGSFSGGFNGDNIAAVNAQLNRPTRLAMDASGNLYIADSSNQRVRRISTDGVITTVAGYGLKGYTGDGGAATTAALNFPVGVAVDNAGNLFIADAENHVVREVSGGVISTVAGNGRGAGTDVGSFSGDGGAATAAGLNTPGVQVSGSGPAQANEFLSIYCTGLGTVQPPVPSGSLGPTNPTSNTTSPPAVTIAGVPAQVSFSGLAPFFVGLYQVNIRAPAGLPSGTQTLQLTINGIPANPVTLSVQ